MIHRLPPAWTLGAILLPAAACARTGALPPGRPGPIVPTFKNLCDIHVLTSGPCTSNHAYANLCWLPRSGGHPEHPHPNFSPDGTRIAFTMLDDAGHCQAAYVDVREAMRNWDRIAEGAGEIASPAWK